MTTTANLPLGPKVLELDYDREVERVCARLREILSKDLSRRGLVVAISGGIDSSVSASLSVKRVSKLAGVSLSFACWRSQWCVANSKPTRLVMNSISGRVRFGGSLTTTSG